MCNLPPSVVGEYLKKLVAQGHGCLLFLGDKAKTKNAINIFRFSIKNTVKPAIFYTFHLLGGQNLLACSFGTLEAKTGIPTQGRLIWVTKDRSDRFPMLEGEENLIQQAKKGDATCFGRLYDHYMSRIYRFIALKVSTKAEAEDLAHEVFTKAWRNMPRYILQGFPFSSWLYQIARRQVIDHYRVKKEHQSLDGVNEEALSIAATLDQDTDLSLSVGKVKLAIKKLNSDQQDVILMRFVDDLSHREIAKAMKKSEGAVRLIQHRAIHELRKILQA